MFRTVRAAKVPPWPSKQPASDVAFSPAVKRVQVERGSRAAYARQEAQGGFESEVTPDLAGFLAEVDTAFLATASADGQPYVQHRGGPKGFIRALDATTLGFLDLPGNRQYVTTGNLRENDRVCLFLIDYARRARVKVWGHARVVPSRATRPRRHSPQEPRPSRRAGRPHLNDRLGRKLLPSTSPRRSTPPKPPRGSSISSARSPPWNRRTAL